MKTAEEILLKHLQQHGCLDADDLSERLAAGQFQPEFDAMEEYAKEVADAKDEAYVLLAQSVLRRDAAEMRVNYLTGEVERLKMQLLRRADQDDVNDGKSGEHRDADMPNRNSGWSV
jgi:uncharacterized small protein (DUF1192 family)